MRNDGILELSEDSPSKKPNIEMRSFIITMTRRIQNLRKMNELLNHLPYPLQRGNYWYSFLVSFEKMSLVVLLLRRNDLTLIIVGRNKNYFKFKAKDIGVKYVR